MHISYNKYGIITGVSARTFVMANNTTKEFAMADANTSDIIGTRVEKMSKKKEIRDLRVACICNWNDACGISTYTRFLMEEIEKKVGDVLIVSERNGNPTHPDSDKVKRCWTRGESMSEANRVIKDWNPDFVIVQHEFGIFPKATHFLSMLQFLKEYNYVVTLHSVYEHLDKAICTSAIDNIIVHTEAGKDCLRRTGHNQNIFVVPHGCQCFHAVNELWNIFQTPYTLVQFGFGFFYKGVDMAIDAIHHLKNSDEKFKDIFYCYLCSDSGHFSSVFNDYYYHLIEKIEKLGLQDNVSIIRKFHSEETINNYLRCAKIALFPYITDPKHVVFGASGAVRVAMSNRIPTIASSAHMFDDLEGVLPRPDSHLELAKEIDLIFSNEAHKLELVSKIDKYTLNNTWDKIADTYLEITRKI
jgi:glycosyltransferase involved in cell wall biosynthesis